MAQTELLNSISKSIDYPVEQNLSASYHCGTFSLIVDTDLWTEQMYYELPWIQLDIYITVGGIDIKYLSCNIMLDTDEPKKPYSVSVYEIPGSFKVKLTPGFDDNVITTHNELCLQEDISNTWGPQTLEFPCSVVWDDSNISSSSGDVGAEVYQARVGADGTTYQTLKARLDADYSKAEIDAMMSNKADIADIPAVPITAIQKNGADITPVGGTVDIIVPTTAEDVGALPDTTRYAAALSLTIDSSTFVVTGQLKDQNGDNLGTAQTIDLPLESVVVDGSYNSQTQKVVLTLQNGNTIEFSVADLVYGLQTELSETNKLNPAYINYDNTHRAVSDAEKSEWNGKQDAIDSSHKLSADLVDDTGATNKFATAEELEQIETNKNNILSIQQTMGDINSVLEEVL